MSIEMPAAAAGEIAQTAGAAEPGKSIWKRAWFETAIAVGFAVTAVLVVSFVAVMTGLV